VAEWTSRWATPAGSLGAAAVPDPPSRHLPVWAPALAPSPDVAIGFLQFAPQLRTETQNLRLILRELGRASDAIVVLPELFLGSYRNFPLFLQDERELGQVLAPLLELTRERRLSVVGSLPICSGGRNYNRAVLVEGGELHVVYDKFQTFGDEAVTFSDGASPNQVVRLKGMRCMVQVCMDVVDPVPLHHAAQEGLQLILGPSTVSVDYLRTIHKARALETQAISVFCNRSGSEPTDGTQYLGSSAIFFPDGTELSVPPDVERLELFSIGAAGAHVMASLMSRPFSGRRRSLPLSSPHDRVAENQQVDVHGEERVEGVVGRLR
jgi:predicted amidohydrolase